MACDTRRMPSLRALIIAGAALFVLAAAPGCKKKDADPRLVGTWDLVVDPELPPHFGFATITSGELVFAKDGTATRTLVLEGETATGPATEKVVSRLLAYGVVEDSEGTWLSYKLDNPQRTEGKVRIDELTEYKLRFFDWGESRATFEFRRRK